MPTLEQNFARKRAARAEIKKHAPELARITERPAVDVDGDEGTLTLELLAQLTAAVCLLNQDGGERAMRILDIQHALAGAEG